MMRLRFYILSVLILGASVRADLIVNEVLANEPGGERALEWIELYNDSPGAANLDFYDLRVQSSSDSALFLLAGSIPARGYLIFSRDSVRFEEHWGDSSGVWGDDATESYSLQELPFQLANAGGRVALYRFSTLITELTWTQSGEDGHSWERFHPTLGSIEQSLDPSGSTPGRFNSVSPLPIDLALENVEVSSDSGRALLAFEIVNRGLSTVLGAFLDVFEYDESAAESLGLGVGSDPVGDVDSGFSVILVGQYQFASYYQQLIASLRLNNDDRPNNNRLSFTAPGLDYPPVILSEFLANPVSTLGSEWVELKNVSGGTIDIAGWLLGDSIGFASISPVELLLGPGQYLVLVEDSTGFDSDYPLYTGLLHQPAVWRTYNNSSDSVRLVDGFGIAADCFYYDEVFDDNHTWSRSESAEHAGRWGRSEDQGGTPGEENRVRFAPEGSQTLGITITPKIISPDGDGLDDTTVIRIKASDASSYTLKLYDSQGRLVRTFEDGAVDLSEQYVWRGRTDGGQRLPIGIYILYFEATGVESIKQTIVVAR